MDRTHLRGSSPGTREEHDVPSSGSGLAGESHDDSPVLENPKPRPAYLPEMDTGEKKHGTAGTPIKLEANYFRLMTQEGWVLNQYHVDFSSEVDHTRVKKAWLRCLMQPLGIGYMFDGIQLFTARLIEERQESEGAAGIPPIVRTIQSKEGEEVTVTITFVKVACFKEPIYEQFYNILIRKCMTFIGMEELGRGYFEPKAAIKFAEDRLELWPGFITSMRRHEDDCLLMCVEVSHKVIRKDTILDFIKAVMSNQRLSPGEKEDALKAELIGSMVMTSYGETFYYITDLMMDSTPHKTFAHKGNPVTFADYYKLRYNLTVKDLTQPLLDAVPARDKKYNKTKRGPIILVPEFCLPMGLTDELRANFQLMKRLGRHLNQGPGERADTILAFMGRLLDSPQIQEELDRWRIVIDRNLVNVEGRQLQRESLVFGNGKHEVNAKGDFTDAFKTNRMLFGVTIDHWAIVAPKNVTEDDVRKLIATMMKVSKPLGIALRQPKVVQVPDMRPTGYMRNVNQLADEKIYQILFLILPNNTLDLYSTIKKRLAVELGIPSQCFLAKNVTSKNLMAIATKVVVQMNAKLGGDPWSMKLPLKSIMFVGVDLYTGSRGKVGGVVGAMVASMNSAYTKYFSTTTIYRSKDELSSKLSADFLKCLLVYKDVNGGNLPEMIFLYRDGVSEGQLEQMSVMELHGVKGVLARISEEFKAPVPKLTFIVVNKKTNARLFAQKYDGSRDNPLAGTIVDKTITLSNRYDFYLVSNVARQGTVSPCSYHVIYDDSTLEADKIHKITYKLCHMYFNWSGAIAMPAPCQYAHKLASITGVAYHAPASTKLEKVLHFL